MRWRSSTWRRATSSRAGVRRPRTRRRTACSIAGSPTSAASSTRTHRRLARAALVAQERPRVVLGPGTMIALRLHDRHDLRLHEEPPPVPADGELLVRVSAVGLCGSDLHWFEEGRIGDAGLTWPLVL